MLYIKAKEFSTRSELENHIRSLCGLTPELKTDYEITGTRDELARLQLSDRRSFWGIRCLISDTPTETNPQMEKPQRGEVKSFGLNLIKNE